LLPYIQVCTMPVWYMVVYTSTSKYENLIPVYTGIYLDARNRLVLSRWWRFQMHAGPASASGRVPISLSQWHSDSGSLGRPGAAGQAAGLTVPRCQTGALSRLVVINIRRTCESPATSGNLAPWMYSLILVCTVFIPSMTMPYDEQCTYLVILANVPVHTDRCQKSKVHTVYVQNA
jgi:hypothetical protein